MREGSEKPGKGRKCGKNAPNVPHKSAPIPFLALTIFAAVLIQYKCGMDLLEVDSRKKSYFLAPGGLYRL